MDNKEEATSRTFKDYARFSKDIFSNSEGKKCYISEDWKKKRPERELYIAPALRSRINEDCVDEMEYAKDDYASEATNRQIYSSANHDGSQKTTNIVPRIKRFENSRFPSNPRNTYDSDRDGDSSDLEDGGSEPMTDEEMSLGTNEKKLDDYWNKERRGKYTKSDHDVETENHQIYTKMSNLTKGVDNSDVKSHPNQWPDFESNKNKRDRNIFLNYDESLSDIEATNGDHIGKGKILTSTPNSDVDDQMVLAAAKFDPEEESELESTLLNQSDVRETTINTDRGKGDYNFEIYHDPSSTTSRHSADLAEIFGNNYISPPVPRSASAFQLPPIHRLPIPVSSPRALSEIRLIPPQIGPQLSSLQIKSPYPSSLQSCSSLFPPNPLRLPPIPRIVSSPCLQLTAPRVANSQHMPSYIPPPVLPRRYTTPHLSRDASNSLHFHQRSINPQGIESNELDDVFYIPPPVQPPQQIRHLNQRENVRSCQLSPTSLINQIVFDGKIRPQDPKKGR